MALKGRQEGNRFTVHFQQARNILEMLDQVTPTALDSKGFHLTQCSPYRNTLPMEVILQRLELQGIKEDPTMCPNANGKY